MAKMVNLTIDGKSLSVAAGTLVVDAAKMIGNDIPVFCYHPKMEPVGMCRMCLVEIGRPVIDRATGQPQLDDEGNPKIQFGPKLDTACTTPVSEGMVVRTNTPKVTDARREILEFLLTSHPLDCPICDKGGECPLQNLTLAHGPGNSRFLLDDKIHLAKHLPLGELIYLDRERCIQCARCVRFQADIAGDPVIGFSQRGRSLEIVTHSDPGFDSYFSGNTSDICPVGALTTADFRFGARPWELKQVASICTQCPVGCNLTLNVRREAIANGKSVIKRVMPRQNEEVNEIWICDKGRWAYHYAEDPSRLVDPLVRKNGELVKATWDEALALAARGLGEAGANLVSLVGGRLPNEDLFALKKLTDAIGGRPVLYSYMAGGDWTARIGLSPNSDIGKMGSETAILVVASNLEEEAPLWYLRVRAAAKRGAKLIVVNPRSTKLDKAATHIVRYAYGDESETIRAFLGSDQAVDSLKSAAQAFAGAENGVIFFGSEGLGLAGSRDLAEACAELLLKTNHAGRINNGLIGVWSKANLQGAWDMGFTPVDDLSALLNSAGAVYIAAADPAGDIPGLAKALSGAGFVVVQELFLSQTARLADVVLPAQSFIEREGTFTSGERRVQRFYQAVAPLRGPRADFRIAAELARILGKEVDGRSAALLMAQIGQQIPGYAGITYPQLAAVREQWPIVHRADLYYGGTSYQNREGLGIQLAPHLLSGSWQYSPADARPSKSKTPGLQAGEVLLVPVTRLYDQGTTVVPSRLLHARLARAEVRLHPKTAARIQVADHDQAVFELENDFLNVLVKLDESLPEGAALVPRSTGIPISAPQPIKLQRLDQVSPAQGAAFVEPSRNTR